MSSKIVNLNKEPYDVYIGRGSKWGNPYSHKDGTKADFKVKNRAEAIAMYRLYITKGDGKHLLNNLDELRDKKLGCYCKPLHCHGDILLELITPNIFYGEYNEN